MATAGKTLPRSCLVAFYLLTELARPALEQPSHRELELARLAPLLVESILQDTVLSGGEKDVERDTGQFVVRRGALVRLAEQPEHRLTKRLRLDLDPFEHPVDR